jgi:hypothetical protein
MQRLTPEVPEAAEGAPEPVEEVVEKSTLLESVEHHPLARSICPLARGWATETYRTSIPLFSQYSQNW